MLILKSGDNMVQYPTKDLDVQVLLLDIGKLLRILFLLISIQS
jgi:hypothetical protein